MNRKEPILINLKKNQYFATLLGFLRRAKSYLKMLIGQPNQRHVLAIPSIPTQPISCHRLSAHPSRPSTRYPITVPSRAA